MDKPHVCRRVQFADVEKSSQVELKSKHEIEVQVYLCIWRANDNTQYAYSH